jgi:hypothetical protein
MIYHQMNLILFYSAQWYTVCFIQSIFNHLVKQHAVNVIYRECEVYISDYIKRTPQAVTIIDHNHVCSVVGLVSIMYKYE